MNMIRTPWFPSVDILWDWISWRWLYPFQFCPYWGFLLGNFLHLFHVTNLYLGVSIKSRTICCLVWSKIQLTFLLKHIPLMLFYLGSTPKHNVHYCWTYSKSRIYMPLLLILIFCIFYVLTYNPNPYVSREGYIFWICTTLIFTQVK